MKKLNLTDEQKADLIALFLFLLLIVFEIVTMPIRVLFYALKDY